MKTNTKLFFKKSPLVLILIGVYGIVTTNFFDYGDYGSRFKGLITIFCQTIIIVGVILYVLDIILERISVIEERLELSRETRLSNIKFISSSNYIEILEQFKKQRYIYKASLYLPSATMDSIFFLKNILSTIKIDSEIRVILNSYKTQDDSPKNMDEQVKKISQQISLRKISEASYLNYSIIILDTKVWVINEYDTESEKSLIFSLSSYDEQGKEFVELVNTIWHNSSDINR